MLGLETLVSIGKQPNTTDPTTLPRQSLNVYSISGGQSEAFVDDGILGGGLKNGSDPVMPAPGLDDHKITIKAPLCINQAPWWFAAFFGDEAATGSDPDFTHAWESGQALPYMFIEHKISTGLYRRHFAVVGESLSIDLDAEREGFGMMEMTFVGLKELAATTALAGTVTAAPVLNRPAQKLCSVIYNAVAGGALMGGKIQFNRVLKRFRSADGTGIPYSVEQDGNSTLTGSIRTRYLGDTLSADAIAQTERALGLHLMKSAARGIKVDLDHMRLTRTPIGIEGPGGLELNFDLRAWQTDADAAMRVSVLNPAETVEFS